MIKIALCDDNREHLKRLYEDIIGYFQTNTVPNAQIYSFDSSEKLIDEMEREKFDVYFLDVLIPGQNGMEIGKRIRKMDEDAVIVYITVSREYAFEAFGVRAFSYLQKPVNKEELSETLDRVLKQIERQGGSKLYVRTKDGLMNVNTGDVMYVENISRCSVYVLKDGRRVTSVCNRGSFEKSVGFLKELPEFVQPHKSYFVNMRCIRTFGSKSMLMDDGTQIAISRKRFAETRRAYLSFLADWGKNL